MVRLLLIPLLLSLLLCPHSALSHREDDTDSLCRRCAVDRFNSKHKEKCRTECPGVTSSPAWPPLGAGGQRDEDRLGEETSSWPSWPPSLDPCAGCSRIRYRSHNEDKCKNCPGRKVKIGGKIKKKNENKEEKKRNRNKKDKTKRKGSKKNNRNRNKKIEEEKKEKTVKSEPNVVKASRYAPSANLNQKENDDDQDLGPFGNFFKSLVIRNTFT